MRLQRLWIVVVGAGLMLLALSACFRDASNGEDNGTAVPVANFLDLASPTATPRADVPTLTATPPRPPTATLAPGGPPINDDDDEDDAPPIPTAELTEEPTDDLPPTISIPTFTPVGSRFGDSGITPTANLPTQPAPNALVTPTALPTTVDECTYVVQANDTLFSIALELETEVDAMVAANPALSANPDALSIGQQLAIPNCETEESSAETSSDDSAEAESEAEDDTTDADAEDTRAEAAPAEDAQADTDAQTGQQIHVVQQGENLFRIALQYNVSVDAIIAANPSISSQATIIQPGQEIIIPAP